MTDQPPRPDRRSQPRQWTIPTPLLVVLGAWLSSLAGIAGSVVITKPQERAELWGPLRWISQHPGPALLVVTAAASLVAWWLGRREQPTTASPPGGSLMGTLTLQRPVPLTRSEATRVRQELLDQVRRTWINSVLDRSLAQVARIELGFAEQPDAVTQPWGTLLRQPGHPDQHLPPGTRLDQLAERFDRHLLVLGAPGAGKTTLLLEYARDLLDQAAHDPAAPIPVVFHLSGWPAEQPPLAEWLVTELGLRYGVSHRLAQNLVERDRLAVLLDGLDEVPRDRRAECVQAVNAFRGVHGGMPLAVCARSREYADLAAKLALSGAVEVQPLDRAQVRRWLAAAGRPLAGLRTILRDREHWLWELLDSPLLLSITALTYQNQPSTSIRGDGSITVLLGAYVDAMLARPRAPLAAAQEQVVYDNADTKRWLAWLAEQMGSESIFYPDWIQPASLPTRSQRWLAVGGLNELLMIGGGVVGGVFGASVGWLAARWRLTLFDKPITVGLSLGLGAVSGVLGPYSGGSMSWFSRHALIRPVEPLRWSWMSLRQSAWKILIALPLYGLLLLRSSTALATLAVGVLGTGLLLAVVMGFSARSDLEPATPFEGIRTARRNTPVGIVFGALVALLLGVVASILTTERMGGLTGGVAWGIFAVGVCMPYLMLEFGLRAGGAAYLRHRLLWKLLRRNGLPKDFLGFLDYADSRALLRRAGGGYLFPHRLLQDYFAGQAEDSSSDMLTHNSISSVK